MKIYFWRTKVGAEVDFVLYKNQQKIIPIEVKYLEMKQTKVSRGFRSFIEAYEPKIGFFITKNYSDEIQIGGCRVFFIPFHRIADGLQYILSEWQDS